jgi:hypothetical protein
MNKMVYVVAVILGIALIAGPVSSDTDTFSIYQGWNLISSPFIPNNPDPAVVFDGLNIDGNLSRWEAASSSFITYDSEDPSAFGSITLGDGYWLYNDSGEDKSVTYQGTAGPTTLTIEIESNGWNLVGCAWDYAVSCANLSILYNGATKSWDDAVAAGWMEDNWHGFNAETQSWFDVSPSGFASDDMLRPGMGYWTRSPVPEPSSMLGLLAGVGGICALIKRRPRK